MYTEVVLKKLFILLVFVAVSVVTVFCAVAHESSSNPKAAKQLKVYCCHGKGDCDKIHTKAECEKEGGKVVKHCKDCK
jgi:hypothetical protein